MTKSLLKKVWKQVQTEASQTRQKLSREVDRSAFFRFLLMPWWHQDRMTTGGQWTLESKGSFFFNMGHVTITGIDQGPLIFSFSRLSAWVTSLFKVQPWTKSSPLTSAKERTKKISELMNVETCSCCSTLSGAMLKTLCGTYCKA